MIMINVLDVEEILVLDNFDSGILTEGPERNIFDFATLRSGPKTNLLTSFTVCSTTNSKFSTTNKIFFQLWTEGGKPWIHLGLFPIKDTAKFTEAFQFVHNEKL